MTTPLQITRYDRLVRRAMNLVGEGAIVTGVLPDVFPTVELENTTIEQLTLAGWKFYLRSTGFTSAVGNRSRAGIFNPVGSGMIGVLTRIDFFGPAAQVISYGLSTTELLTFSSRGFPRDTRVSGQAVLRCSIEDGGTTTLHGRARIVANVQQTLDDQNGIAVLGPGNGMQFSTNTLNTELDITYYWRERAAEAAELNF